MEIDRALEQIDEIHGHLARTEVYRGYRPIPVATGGLVALAAGFAQAWALPEPTPLAFVLFWVGVAAVNVSLIAAEILYELFSSKSAAFRRSTPQVVCQFLPCIAAGAAITTVFATTGEGLVPLLPGIWAILFSLGTLASRPYLPRAIGWVGLFYFVAGVGLLVFAGARVPGPWGMSLVFGPGQLFAAAVLYWNLERRNDGRQEATEIR